MKFLVTRIGCGIAGFKDEEIAPLFRKAVPVSNIYLPQKFYDILLEPYLKHCFYYGKNVPEDYGAHVGHMYEKNWVYFHFGNENGLYSETICYIQHGLGDFHANDGVPISIKPFYSTVSAIGDMEKHLIPSGDGMKALTTPIHG